MPWKASPLSSSSIGNFTWGYIFIHHMICVLLGASCMIWVFDFQFTTIILAVHTFWERHTWIVIYYNNLCASLISFELDNFALVLHLYLFRARWWFYFIEIIDLSCFTYIILRVFLSTMVISFGYKFSPNMIGIQGGYNKNFHIKCFGSYEKFDSLWLFWDIKMVILEPC